jgi:DNA-binding transcriptional MerR regulator
MVMSKSVDAFRTIGEVSDDLGVPKHVLRFWENKFPQLKPMKRGGGRRYYRPEDVALLIGIHRLLHGSGYTIKGVQRILRDDGVEAVKAAGREDLKPAVASVGSDGSGQPGMASKRAAKTQAAMAADADLLQHLADVARELEACLNLVKPDGTAQKAKTKAKTATGRAKDAPKKRA